MEEWTNWLDASDHEQLVWAETYLRDTLQIQLGARLENVAHFAETIRSHSHIFNDPKKLDRMKAAWRKEKQRKKDKRAGKTSVTVRLSAQASDTLTKLAIDSNSSKSRLIEQWLAQKAKAYDRAKEKEQERQQQKLGTAMRQRLEGTSVPPMAPALQQPLSAPSSGGRYTSVKDSNDTEIDENTITYTESSGKPLSSDTGEATVQAKETSHNEEVTLAEEAGADSNKLKVEEASDLHNELAEYFRPKKSWLEEVKTADSYRLSNPQPNQGLAPGKGQSERQP